MMVAINILILLYSMEMEEINYYVFVFVFVILDTGAAPWNTNIFANVGKKLAVSLIG